METDEIIIALLAGGSVGALISYYKSTRLHKKEIVAKATETAIARVEILYKVLRRTKDKSLLASDELAIRNEMHEIQKKTDFYLSILKSESAWLGASYEKLIEGIKKETEPKLQEGWKQKPKGVGVQLKGYSHPVIKPLRDSFTKDVQRFFNPIKRLFFASLYRFSKLLGRR